MITPVNVLLIIIWGILIPFLAGVSVSRVMDEDKLFAPCRNMVYGYMIMFALFLIPAVPMIVARAPFHVLKALYSVMILAVAASGLYFLIKERGKISGPGKQGIKDRFVAAVWLGAVVLIIFETALPTFRMHVDTDDSRFIAEAMEAIHQDTMLQHNPITGDFNGGPIGEQKKDVTAPWPIFLAVLSGYFDLPPAIAAHSVLPLLFVPLSYMAFYLAGTVFFKDPLGRGMYMLFLSVIHLFSFETIYATGYTLMTIIWQGRSVMSVIMLPLLWYALTLNIDKEEIRRKDYMFMAAVMLANSMLSSWGSVCSVFFGAAFMCTDCLKSKSLRKSLPWILCMLPSVVLALFYYVIRNLVG